MIFLWKIGIPFWLPLWFAFFNLPPPLKNLKWTPPCKPYSTIPRSSFLLAPPLQIRAEWGETVKESIRKYWFMEMEKIRRRFVTEGFEHFFFRQFCFGNQFKPLIDSNHINVHISLILFFIPNGIFVTFARNTLNKKSS